jgi:Domain of unknown function (DUF4258)
MTEEFLDKITRLALAGRLIVSTHADQELANDEIDIDDVLDGLANAIVVESYPDYHKGPYLLVLIRTRDGAPIHALLGTSTANPDISVIITAYRPATDRWNGDFTKRLTR